MADQFSLQPTEDELRELQGPFEASYEEHLIGRYAELMRDKRSIHDIDCPTWTNGCHCLDMIVPHESKQGKPWCPTCQSAHDEPHPAITQAQFVRRFRKGE